MNERNASAAESADRLLDAAARSNGALQAFANCAHRGLLSPAGVQELNDVYRNRVEPLLESASFLQRTADLVRGLVAAGLRLRRIRPASEGSEREAAAAPH